MALFFGHGKNITVARNVSEKRCSLPCEPEAKSVIRGSGIIPQLPTSPARPYVLMCLQHPQIAAQPGDKAFKT